MQTGRNTAKLNGFYKNSAKELKKLTFLPFNAWDNSFGRDIPVDPVKVVATTCILSPVLLALSLGTTALAASLALLLAISALFTYPIALAKDASAEDNSRPSFW